MISTTHSRRLPVRACVARRALEELTADAAGYVIEHADEREILCRITDPDAHGVRHRFTIVPDRLACVVRHSIETGHTPR